MNFGNFEQKVGDKIIQRGKTYFDAGAVINLEEEEEGMWHAEVLGTNGYEVSLGVYKDEIQDWECDCPYDFGIMCKHVVAVIYAVVEKHKLRSTEKKSAKKKKSEIDEIFEKTSKDDLVGFIRSALKRNKTLKNKFKAHFFDLIDETPDSKYRNYVTELFKSYTGSYGSMDYRSVKKFAQDLSDLLEKAKKLFEQENISESLTICKILIEEIPEFVKASVDVGEEMDIVFEASVELINDIISQSPPLLKDTLFEYFIEECKKEKYKVFSFENYLMELIILLISDDEQQEVFFNYIDGKIEKLTKENYSEYNVVYLLRQKIILLERRGKDDDVQKILKDNIQYEQLQKMYAHKMK